MTAITKIEIIIMTSLELVDFINEDRKARAEAAGAAFPSPGFAKLEHADFMKKVPQVLGEVAGNFSCYYTASNGKQNPMYRFPKREACLMAMSYSYELQAKVFDRMTALEEKQAPALPNFADPVVAARAWADAKEEQQTAVAALALAAPKVEFVDRYAAANGAKGFRQVAKLLQANEHEFRAWLQDSKVMYRLGGEWAAYQNHIDAGRFVVKTGVATANEHAFNTTLFTPKGVEWVAGEWGKRQAAKRAEVAA